MCISDNSKAQLAPNIKSHKLWYQARVLLLHVPVAGNISTCQLICYFFSPPAAFGFWASSPLDNINLNPGHSLSNFKAGISAAVYVTLETKQLISHKNYIFILSPLARVLTQGLFQLRSV